MQVGNEEGIQSSHLDSVLGKIVFHMFLEKTL